MDLECPYCGKEQDVNHDDGFGYEENVNHEMECIYCNKNFVFQTTVMFYYTPKKADCLNDGNHEYKMTTTSPIEFSQMECNICGDRRDLTEKERKERNIRSKKEYFESITKK